MPKKTKEEIQNALANFYGTMQYYKFSLVCPDLVLTDGAEFVAKECEAYWLMDLIASYQAECAKDEQLKYMQFWTLKVTDGTGVVTCERDSNDIAFRQEIPYTDFPLDEIKLYCTNNVIMLTSEY